MKRITHRILKFAIFLSSKSSVKVLFETFRSLIDWACCKKKSQPNFVTFLELSLSGWGTDNHYGNDYVTF